MPDEACPACLNGCGGVRADCPKVVGAPVPAEKRGVGRPTVYRPEFAEQARARRQPSLLLTMAGDADGKPRETQDVKPVSSTITSTEVVVSSVAPPPAREAADWVSLGGELAEACGMDVARGRFDFSPVKGWLDAGASVALVADTVLGILARPGSPKGRVTSLRYFDRAVREAMEQRQMVAEPALRDTADEAARIAAVEARIAAAQRGVRVAMAA